MSVVSEITRIKSAKSDLKTAINSKLGSNTPIQDETIDDYASFVDNIPSGGNVVNGIIEQYKAESGTIDANTFVEFVNNYDFTVGTDTRLNGNRYSSQSVSAVKLNDNKVFIAHGSNDSNYYLSGMVCTIDGNTITAGTDTQLSNYTSSGYQISAVALSDDKVFIAHSYGNNEYSSYYRLYGLICTIDGTTITKGTDTQLSSTSYSGYRISAVVLSSDKVFIAHSYNTGSTYLYGIVCEISGTTITKGTDTQLSSNSYSGQSISAVALSDSKVFIAHNYDSGKYLYGLICTISGDTITTGTDTRLSNVSGLSNFISVVKLSENKVFIVHSRNYSSYYHLNGMICTINDNIITAGTDTALSSEPDSANYISVVALSDSKVFITHSYGSGKYLYGLICTIGATTITIGTDTQLSSTSYSGNEISAVALSSDKVFIAHGRESSYYYLYSMIAELPEITIQPSTSNIDGLTKTECSTTTAGDVFVLDN